MIKTFGKDNLNRIASRAGIYNTENFQIKKDNLIVGINGSGKTRFLELLRDLFYKEDYCSVYMDFSQLGNKYQKGPSTGVAGVRKDFFNWCLMFHSNIGNSELLKDFVLNTNNNIESFIKFINNATNREYSQMRFDELNPILNDILGREIVLINNKFYITGRGENESEIEISKAIPLMSPGERCILYFIFQIAILESQKIEYALLIDEPETHMHPLALVKLIKSIKQKLKYNYLFISSHSVFLLPLFNFDEIKMIENSSIKKPESKLYNDIYESLIGFDDNENNNIYKFLSSIYEWNFSAFIAECFLSPKEGGRIKIDDPQFLKMKRVIQLFSNKEEIRVLDFGGGTGRMAKCLGLIEDGNESVGFLKSLKYDIYDKFLAVDSPICEKKWFGESYNDIKDIKKNNGKNGKYDIIIMYNMLHEVSVTEWCDLLNDVIELLNENGCLLFGERRVLSMGERPYGKSGYLILNEKELSLIFSSNIPNAIKIKEIQNDPTLCFTIYKKCMCKVTQENISIALRTLLQRIKTEIDKCITIGRMDRKYAFYCQEYFNCQRAIDEVMKEITKV